MKPKPHQKIQSKQQQEATEPSDFAFKITQIAVSQICQSLGFKSAQCSALETLTHVATLYLKTLAKTAASYSNASNRTQSNVFDLINSLHDLYSVQGFEGAATLHDSSSAISLLSSSVLKDLSFFVNSTDEIPFAKPIPRRNSGPFPWDSHSLDVESRLGVHIPKWLPRFPDESTYKKSQDMVCDKRIRRDLVLWENSDLVQNCGAIGLGGISRENQKKKNGGDLASKRRRVRFKIGEAEKDRVV